MNNKLLELDKKAIIDLRESFKELDDIAYFNSEKVLDAFHKEKVSTEDFNGTTGYGYSDEGRDKLERIYANIFKSEDALVRNQFISGSHALSVTYFALLRPNDLLLSITGKPYDTMEEVIGIRENNSSLKAFGINYDQIDLVDNDFDYDQIKKYLSFMKVKVLLIQRSKGYSSRKSITLNQVAKVINEIRKVDKDVIIMVDNCYCEFTTKKEPIEVGANVAIGSLIKNLGGGIAPNGAYVVGDKKIIDLVAERLTLPGEGREVGPSLTINKQFYQGLFLAPSVVNSALKTSLYTSYMLSNLGFNVEPLYNEEHPDIVLSIIFNDQDKLIKYIKSIQRYSPIDSHYTAVSSSMPGYTSSIIMASGSFVTGSSIELSCDAPIRPPFIAYQQGSLTFDYGRIMILKTINDLLN